MNDRSIIELIYEAKQNRIDVFLNEGQLQVKLPKDKTYDKNILEQLKANKEKLAAFLKNNERGTTSGNKINRFNRETISRIPLSFSQERLWFIDQLEGSVKYNLPSVIRLNGKLDIAALEFTLLTIVSRHEILRTVIYEEEGKGYQRPVNNRTWKLEIVDGFMYKSSSKELHRYIQQLIEKPFNLSKDFMFRAHLIKLDEYENILLVTIHHIASDAWSMAIIVNEVIELYKASITGLPACLKPLEIEYADYAVWQRNDLQGTSLDKSLLFWQEKLAGTTPLHLPAAYAQGSAATGNGAIKRFSISKSLSDDLLILSQQQQSTLFMSLLAAFNILLFRYCQQQDICVGTSVASRTRKELEGLVGFFVNLLALRTKVNDEQSFIELLRQVKVTTLEAYEHQDTPFEKVVDLVVKERDAGKNPLIQVMFIMLNTPEVPELQLGEVTLFTEELPHTKTLFDISFFIKETGNGIEGWVEYNVDLYSESIITQMISSFTKLLTKIVENPNKQIGLLPVLNKTDEKRLLIDFNSNKQFYEHDKSIVELFEDQAAQTPHATAVMYKGEKLSYQELNERSNQLAHYLIYKGVKEEALVPICIERGLELIVGIIGILKAGGAYVPIDAKYPAERISFMLRDTSASIALCSKSSKNIITKAASIETIVLDTNDEIRQNQSIQNLKVSVNPGHLAYVIYTSGSTGKPKGVMIEHKSVTSLVRGIEFVSSTNTDVLLSTGSPSFDATTFEYWSMLLNGGQLILCNEENLLDKDLLKQEIQISRVTKIWFTSSWFNQLVDTDISVFDGLQTLLVGGEKLSEKHVNKMRITYPDINIINGYGPTENTTFSLTFHIKEQEINRSIPIGKPLNNRSAFIVDPKGGLVPIGVTGEICVGGTGLARGYLNNAELTEEKFVLNPFEPGSKMYKTGDLGYWLEDGNICYQGRTDDQVKIRGYRIELGEVESVIARFDGILQNVVVAREEENGRKRLVAYVVAETIFDQKGMVDFISTELPEYLLPSLWIQLDELPLTANGKVDKKALPDPELTETEIIKDFAEPQTELQAKLVLIWQELLDAENVGINDNFFELGGDSILAIQLVSRARNAGIEIKVADVFGCQTVNQLSELLERESKTELVNQGDQDYLSGLVPLLPVQQWYFETQHVALSHFNQSVLFCLDKTITEEALHQTIKQSFDRHDALRFRYYQEDGHWKQEYSSTNIELIVEDLPEDKIAISVSIAEIADKYQRSLNIEKGEIIKIVLIKTPQLQLANRLLIIIHHLAVDGVSWRILLEEIDRGLTEIINNGKAVLLPKTSSYRQWYVALKEYGKTTSLLSQLHYWKRTVAAFKPFSTDTNYEGKVLVKEIESFTLKLEANLTRNMLKEVPRVYHTEINDILVGALAKTLCKWTSENAVVIGLEGHGRELVDRAIDLSHTIGWFTSLYPLSIDVEGANGYDDLLKNVKEQIRQVPDKGLGYGVLRYINKEKSLPKNDPWDIQFNYMGQIDNVVKESEWLSAAEEQTGAGRNENQEVSEKLSLNCLITAGELVCNWRFSTKHFYEKTIIALAGSYVEELKSLIGYCMQQGKSGAVYTPSDFGLGSSVTYQELDSFLEEDNTDNIMSF